MAGYIWRFDLGQALESSPAVVDGRVIVGCDDGSVYGFAAP